MSSLLYVVAIIIIGIVSSLNKKGKKEQPGIPRGGMPTFGGDGDSPLRRVQPAGHTRDRERGEQSGSGFPVPAGTSPRQSLPEEEREYDASPAFPESAENPTPDYMTGEGMSLEQMEDGVEVRTAKMHQELERRQSVFDGIGGAADTPSASKAQSAASGTAARSHFASDREGLQNGLIWAEVLGPPRSRRPHSPRR